MFLNLHHDKYLIQMYRVLNLSNFQAVIIAFSSDFLEKLIYLIQNKKIQGFTESNLAYSTNFHTNQTCRYFESQYHGDINSETYQHYRLIVFKLFFVLIYQNFASWLQKYIELSVPDIPRRLDLKLKKEKYLIKERLMNLDSTEDFRVDLIQ